MRLPVLHLMVPSVPCALMVNGTLCGTSSDSPVLPVSPTGTVFITCLPLANAGNIVCLPHTVCFSLQQGVPSEQVYGCKLYLYASGVLDVELQPTVYHGQSETQAYSVSRVQFSHSGHSHAATLFYDNGWRIAIEETGKDVLLLCQPIDDLVDAKVQAVNCFASSDILVTGRGSHGPRSLLFSAVGGKYALMADEDARCAIQGHTAVFTQPLFDVASHEKRFSLSIQDDKPMKSESVFGHFSASPTPIASAALVCAALCEAVSLSLAEEALGYLTPELKKDMTLSDLTDFFGAFVRVYEVEGEGPYSVYLAYALFENVCYLQSFRFEMEGMLVANILPEE